MTDGKNNLRPVRLECQANKKEMGRKGLRVSASICGYYASPSRLSWCIYIGGYIARSIILIGKLPYVVRVCDHGCLKSALLGFKVFLVGYWVSLVGSSVRHSAEYLSTDEG